MSAFNEDQFEKKLLALKDTHESISGLSSWCLEHPQQHKKIVSIWLQVLKKVKIEQRLTLFHLANDVIQYSKRKGFDFVESWGTALQKATTMVRDDKVKNKILRLFKIWDERSIYDEAFLVDLSGLLSSRKPAQSNQDAQDFQCKSTVDVIDKIVKMLLDVLKSPGHDTSGERRASERHRSANALQSGPICCRANVKRGVTIDLSGERQHHQTLPDYFLYDARRSDESRFFPRFSVYSGWQRSKNHVSLRQNLRKRTLLL
ncbi:Regulation of nuclear pre-mRNA domain-containing protein 2 [Homalodisca vitripennis]|nr:Regulation of nuclear pre-mRNA domain-containing protein 2 [Homalodisca vitripennis]